MSYLYIIGVIVCLVWLAAIFPWLLLVAGVVWFVYLLGN